MEFILTVTEDLGLGDRERLELSGEMGEALEGYGVEVLVVETDPTRLTFAADDALEAEDILAYVQGRLTNDGWEGVRFGLSAPEE